jgi:hypothetical protein
MPGRNLSYSILILLAALAAAAGADQVVLNPTKDNTMYEEMKEGEKSNGAGDYFFCGRTAKSELRRALVAFDVAGAIPAGSTINSALLTLTMSRTIAGPEPVELHVVLVDWGEGTSDAPGEEGDGAPAQPGDATWIHRFYDTDLWTNEGGDFAASASAVQTVDQIGTYTWGSTPAMVADVQDWLDNPSSNFGWLVLGNEGQDGKGSATAKRFNSRENSSEGFATVPMLAINFTPPIAVDLMEFEAE